MEVPIGDDNLFMAYSMSRMMPKSVTTAPLQTRPTLPTSWLQTTSAGWFGGVHQHAALDDAGGVGEEWLHKMYRLSPSPKVTGHDRLAQHRGTETKRLQP